MTVFQLEEIRKTLHQCLGIVTENKDALTEIDSINGDGDMGVSMELGAAAMVAAADTYEGETIGPMLQKAGMAFNKAAPSTMGTLIGMALVSLGNTWKGKQQVEEQDVVAAPRVLCEAISRLGKAKVGDKTVLDALYPFAETLEGVFAETSDFSKAYEQAVLAAKAGLEKTKGMQATVGRARWLGERAVQAYDGGALLCVLIVEGVRS